MPRMMVDIPYDKGRYFNNIHNRQKQDQPRIVSMHSGGMDSAAVTLSLLQTHTQHVVHAHHVVFKNWAERWRAERAACQRQFDWFSFNYRDRFEWSYSEIDFSQSIGYCAYDAFTVGFVAMNIARAGPTSWGFDIPYIAFGHRTPRDTQGWYKPGNGTAMMTDKDGNISVRPMNPDWWQTVRRAYTYTHSQREHTGQHRIASLICPLEGVSKEAVYAMLPEALQQIIWSCHMPVQRGRYYYACGKCHSCSSFKELGLIHPVMHSP